MRTMDHSSAWWPVTVPTRMRMRDARVLQDAGLETTGFVLRAWRSGCSDNRDDAVVVGSNYFDVIVLLQAEAGACDVLIKGQALCGHRRARRLPLHRWRLCGGQGRRRCMRCARRLYSRLVGGAAGGHAHGRILPLAGDHAAAH